MKKNSDFEGMIAPYLRWGHWIKCIIIFWQGKWMMTRHIEKSRRKWWKIRVLFLLTFAIASFLWIWICLVNRELEKPYCWYDLNFVVYTIYCLYLFDICHLWIRELERSQKYSCHTLDELYKTTSETLSVNLVLELLRYIARQPPGAVLVFLPGWDVISKLHNLIQEDQMLGSRKSGRWIQSMALHSCIVRKYILNFFTVLFIINEYLVLPGNYLVIPLHSMMPTVNQREVFDRPPAGKYTWYLTAFDFCIPCNMEGTDYLSYILQYLDSFLLTTV